MKTKHTEGKWATDGKEVRSKDNLTLVANLHNLHNQKETEANAKLIATAPELLYALRHCLLNLKDSKQGNAAWSLAKNAIKKATE